MRFELTTFSLARRRSTAELRPHVDNKKHLLQRGLAWGAPKRWTRSDSNRRSPPCKGGAFPLGHGPARQALADGADERTRTSTPRRAIDPKSIASANSATSACKSGGLSEQNALSRGQDSPYSRFCSPHHHPGWPWSCRHLSQRPRPLAVCGLLGVTQPRPHRCDEIPLLSRTRSPCSRLHARLAGHIAVTAGGLLPHPFTPYR